MSTILRTVGIDISKDWLDVFAPCTRKLRFARSIPMMLASSMWMASSLRWSTIAQYHLGTSRCRREGASTPSGINQRQSNR